MQLQDANERTFYEQLAIDDALSVKRLTAAIQGNHYLSALEQPKGKPLKLPRPTNPSYLYEAEVRDLIVPAQGHAGCEFNPGRLAALVVVAVSMV